MAIMARDNGGGGDFEPTPTGTQQAVCVFVEDIGTHEGSFEGKPTMRHQVVVCWELSEKMTEGDNTGKPFMASKYYTLSLNEKSSLRKDLESWRGQQFTEQELEGFDLECLKGKNCLLNIIETTKRDKSRGTKIASISKAIKGMPLLTPFNTKPPAWIAKKRAESVEAKEQNESDPMGYSQEAPSDEERLPF